MTGVEDIIGTPGAGFDGISSSFYVTIPAGTTSGSIQVMLGSDYTTELDEELTVTLTLLDDGLLLATPRTLGVSASNNSGIVKIFNDD